MLRLFGKQEKATPSDEEVKLAVRTIVINDQNNRDTKECTPKINLEKRLQNCVYKYQASLLRGSTGKESKELFSKCANDAITHARTLSLYLSKHPNPYMKGGIGLLKPDPLNLEAMRKSAKLTLGK